MTNASTLQVRAADGVVQSQAHGSRPGGRADERRRRPRSYARVHDREPPCVHAVARDHPRRHLDVRGGKADLLPQLVAVHHRPRRPMRPPKHLGGSGQVTLVEQLPHPSG